MNQFSKNDKQFMQRALALAKKAESMGEVPVGAVVVLDNQIVGEGHNSPISQHDPSAHAEIIALRQAANKIQNYRLVDATLYVTLEPCMMCVGALVHARIRRLVFGANDPKTGAVESVFHLLDADQLNHHLIYDGGLMQEACSQLLKDFFQQRR